MKTVGVIGLGNMGRGMAGSLRRGDYTVLGYDAAPGVALALAGQEVLSARDSVAEIARDADVLLLSLPTSA
ncbi:NAD(P)-binding domain-containing protein, partial [Burkholderia gladioli]